MNESTLNQLKILAEKLGTTTEYLWPLMIKQQYLEPWHMMIMSLMMGSLTYILFRTKNSLSKLIDSDIIVPACIYVTMCFCIISFWAGLDEFLDLLNPEYAAFKDIMKLIK
jgi:hypothetical protein